MVLSVQYNNPGNLRPVGQNDGFQSFSSPQEGLDAMRQDLLLKIAGESPAMLSKYGEGYEPTLENLLSTWAPPTENDTQNYIDFVSSRTGLPANQALTEADLEAVMPAMVEMEGGPEAVAHFYGNQDFSALTDEELMKIAGVSSKNSQDQPNYEDLSNEELAKLAGVGLPLASSDSVKEGISRTIFDQTMQGATFGLADEASDRLGALGAFLVTDEPYDALLEIARAKTAERNKRQWEQRPGAAVAGNILGGLGTGIAGATTKAGSAIGNFIRSGNTLARIAKGALAGSASGGLYGYGSGVGEDRAASMGRGAVLGAVGGGAVPLFSAGASGAVNAIVPKIDEAIKPLAQRAKDLGIPLRADQIAPSRVRNTVQKISQEVPFNGVEAFEKTQQAAWTKAVAKTIGTDADELTPDVINASTKRIGNTFQAVLSGETVEVSDDMIAQLNKIAAEADYVLTEDLAKIVRKNVDKLSAEIGPNRTIGGEKLASFRSELIKKIPRASGGAREFLGDIAQVVDDGIVGGLDEVKTQALKDARRQWRNLKTIEPLLEKSTDGSINPTQLLNRVGASKYIKASKTETGADDLVDLARIGKEFLAKKGGSDTFQKSAGLGAIAGFALDPLSALAVTGGGIGTNRAFQSGINSNQALINLALKRPESVLRLPKNEALDLLIRSGPAQTSAISGARSLANQQ